MLWNPILKFDPLHSILMALGQGTLAHDAMLAETMACKHGLDAAEHFGISQVARLILFN